MLKKALMTVFLLALAMVSAFAASHTHHRMHHRMGMGHMRMHHVRSYTRHMKSGKRVHVRGHYQR